MDFVTMRQRRIYCFCFNSHEEVEQATRWEFFLRHFPSYSCTLLATLIFLHLMNLLSCSRALSLSPSRFRFEFNHCTCDEFKKHRYVVIEKFPFVLTTIERKIEKKASTNKLKKKASKEHKECKLIQFENESNNGEMKKGNKHLGYW